MGRARQTAHDERYDIAEEFMEVVYKLREGSWDDSAVLCDRERRIFTDPAKVRRIQHHGKHFDVDAIHLCEPSPQRTPLIYQAGTSPKGREFAAKHAECVFLSGPSQKTISPRVADLRRLAPTFGRRPEDIKIFALMTVVLGATDAEARAKYDDHRCYASGDGALTLVSGWTGVDFSKFDPDEEVRHVTNEAGRTAMENITRADPDRTWTVRQVAEHVAIGGIGPVLVGTPAYVADVLEDWIEATDIDGFNLAFAVAPETYVDIVDHLVPELQKRGRYKRDYRPGALREKLFDGSARAPERHPAAAHRFRPYASAAE